LALLTEELAEHPHDARWWYYQGQTLSCLGELAQAESCFERASDLSLWDEQGAWSRYSAARCALQMGCLERALTHCVLGLRHDPGFVELHWCAGVICLQSQRPQAALAWGMTARLWGSHEGHATAAGRLAHAEPEAAWEGPYRVLEQAYRELGRLDEAAECGRLASEASARR
jgi:tetratricopeptide (TPR) repeat protein